MWDKMDDEKKKKMTEMLEELGIDEKIVDEHLMHVAKKVSFRLIKLRLMLDERGVDEAKAKEIIEKMVGMAMGKDLAKVKEWHKEHMEEHEHDHHEEPKDE